MYNPEEGVNPKNVSYYRVRTGLGIAATTVLAVGTATATYFMLKEKDKNNQAGGLYNNETCPGSPLGFNPTPPPYPMLYDCQPNFANSTNTTIDDSWYYDNSFNQTCTDLNNIICATASLAKPLFWGTVGGTGAVFVAAAGTVASSCSKPSSKNDEETTLLGKQKPSFFDRCCPSFWNKRENNVKKLLTGKGETQLYSSTENVGVGEAEGKEEQQQQSPRGRRRSSSSST